MHGADVAGRRHTCFKYSDYCTPTGAKNWIIKSSHDHFWPSDRLVYLSIDGERKEKRPVGVGLVLPACVL